MDFSPIQYTQNNKIRYQSKNALGRQLTKENEIRQRQNENTERR